MQRCSNVMIVVRRDAIKTVCRDVIKTMCTSLEHSFYQKTPPIFPIASCLLVFSTNNVFFFLGIFIIYLKLWISILIKAYGIARVEGTGGVIIYPNESKKNYAWGFCKAIGRNFSYFIWSQQQIQKYLIIRNSQFVINTAQTISDEGVIQQSPNYQ